MDKSLRKYTKEVKAVGSVQEEELVWAYRTKDGTSDTHGLQLLDNVQFIYELALAQLELQSQGATFEVTNGLREFRLLNASNIESLARRLAYFKSVKGTMTDYFKIIQKNRTRSVNQYLTHWIYPYKGKFHPQMIRGLLNILQLEPGDTVLDPFIGSGTTAVEAQLLGINVIGIDISPLSVLQTKVKTESHYVLEDIHRHCDKVLSAVSSPLFAERNSSLLATIDSFSDDRARAFYKMAFLVAISDVARRRRDFGKSFSTNLHMMLGSLSDQASIIESLSLAPGKVDIRAGDARALPLERESIDGIITSPPYSIALDYVENDAHAFSVLGYDLTAMREQFIGVRGRGALRIRLYNEDLKASLAEMARVLKPGRCAAIVLGNAVYQGAEIKTVEFTIDYMSRIGLRLVHNIDKIIFGLYNVMQRDNILIFQKEA